MNSRYFKQQNCCIWSKENPRIIPEKSFCVYHGVIDPQFFKLLTKKWISVELLVVDQILEVTINQHLTFTKHVKKMQQKAKPVQLIPLIRKYSKLNLQYKLVLIKTITYIRMDRTKIQLQ